MNPLKPTFYLGLSPNDPTLNQYNLFKRNIITPVLPKTFNAGDSDTLRINFIAGDTLISRTGWHEALLGLSFLKSDDPAGDPISKIDTFYLRVKKTPYFVSGYDDEISFDSVYVNPNVKVEKNWRVKNVWTQNQPLIGFEKKLISQPVSEDEFLVENLPENMEIIPHNTINIPLTYYPKNRGKDSMFLKLKYRPLAQQFPDSVDFAWTALRGIGVEQDIQIKSSNFNWYGDTIDLGDILIDKNLNIDIKIINKGNLPFGILSQKILNNSDNNINQLYAIIQPFTADGKDIQVNGESDCKIVFNPNGPGYFSARLQIESDILNRGIFGTQPDKRFKYIYLKANVKSPVLVSAVKEIDFGNIIINNTNCFSDRDTTLSIFNSGNAELIVSQILFNPEYPEGNFYSRDFQSIIQPGKSEPINITFHGNTGEYNSYSSEMILVTNQPAPNDTFTIKISAKSIPPVTTYLTIPQNLKSKPGTIIEVPIILNSNGLSPASLAKSFSTSLFYNRLLLEFNGLRTINTACEGAFNFGDSFENPDSNELFINMIAPASNYFINKDTLLFVKFKTYLGNSPATEISFINPKFGDGKCDEIFTLINRNGIFSTDSVCGLDYKALPSMTGKFAMSVFYNFTNTPNQIQFEIPYQTNVNISIIDILGNKVKELFENQLPAGIYKMNDDFDCLPTSTYFIILKTPAYSIVKPFSVVR
jgi:hypothetical protein